MGGFVMHSVTTISVHSGASGRLRPAFTLVELLVVLEPKPTQQWER